MIRKFSDNRGSLLVTTPKKFDQILVSTNVNKHTFRGMHYQTEPWQVKHMKVLQGSIVDFFYDLQSNELYLKQLDTNSDLFTVREGYAHGYLTLEPNTIVYYGVEGEWNPETEKSIIWDRIPDLKNYINNIRGGKKSLTISDKDKLGK